MKLATLQRLGACALVLGALLLAAYAVAFPTLLPMDQIDADFSRLVRDPDWRWITSIALAGVALLMAGFAAVYTRLWSTAGATGLVGFLSLELAYLLQACTITWELFLFPLIARHETAVALLRDKIIDRDPAIGLLNIAATATIFAGVVLFSFALVRSRVFPRSAGLLIFVGALLYGLQLTIGIAIAGIVIHALGCLLLGLRLMKSPLEPVAV